MANKPVHMRIIFLTAPFNGGKGPLLATRGILPLPPLFDSADIENAVVREGYAVSTKQGRRQVQWTGFGLWEQQPSKPKAGQTFNNSVFFVVALYRSFYHSKK